MREIVHWPRGNRLVYLHANATPEYWDEVWRAQGKAPPPSPDDEVVQVTSRFLAPGSLLLEGGCGKSDKVKSLCVAGFRAIGVDFAEDAVRQAQVDYPGLDVRKGDVRKLDFPDATFDGYWSIGVIEHFWEGYEEILAEAARVVRPGGVLFLTAPWFSPYRMKKARSGGYEVADYQAAPAAFYQFALPRQEVEERLSKHGFTVESWSGVASEMSMREDMPSLRRQVEWLFGSRGGIFKRIFRKLVVRVADRYCGHSFLAVARRVNGTPAKVS